MKGDFTRSTFRPEKHYHDVLMQQGRVQLDADWNEELAIGAYLDEVSRLDVIGACGAPKHHGGFRVDIAPGGTDLTISPGRIYVGGLLCESESTPVAANALTATTAVLGQLSVDGVELAAPQWVDVFDAAPGATTSQVVRIVGVAIGTRTVTFDPLAAATLSALTAAGAKPAVRRVASYGTQPLLPAPDLITPGGPGKPGTLTLKDGTYLAYVDAWLLHVIGLDDPDILEPALGGPDTATRAQTVAQVRLHFLDATRITDCTAAPGLPTAFIGSTQPGDRPPTTGRLSARAQPPSAPTDICIIPPDAGYQGVENQLYRVEVHDPGDLKTATFKWSRENGSIAVAWTGATGQVLTVDSTGRDTVLGFASGQLVELIDGTRELQGKPGTLRTLTAPPGETTLTVSGAAVTFTDYPLHPKVRRWDCAQLTTVDTPAGNDGFLPLENGVEVRFEEGHYNTGDYWLIPGRAGAVHDVAWPRDDGGNPLPRPPEGIVHHYCPLALVHVKGTTLDTTDCRHLFPSLTTMCAEDVCFDNANCQLAGATTVQEALDALCEESTLRRHKKHLHGWGIVCGLEVDCGPDPEGPRHHVTVRTGYAIDCEGNDVMVGKDLPVDVLDLVARATQNGGLLREGSGEVCLVLDEQQGAHITFGVEKFDPSSEKSPALLADTLLWDIYNDCLKNLYEFLRSELGAGSTQSGLERPTLNILESFFAQVLNAGSGQFLYISKKEADIAQSFYDKLKAMLESETFCAMFDNAHPFPPYPAALPPIDTIFGVGHHDRIRLRPGKIAEAYTVGGGINPVQPSGYINRYDLTKGILVEQWDPITGAVVNKAQEGQKAGAVVRDVAFSADGGTIYMIAQAPNADNTLFRAGVIHDQGGVTWGNLETICGVQLVTLATTKADLKTVYALGLSKGLYAINPDAVDPNLAPRTPFTARGHLVITDDGMAYATSANGPAASLPAPNYDTFVHFPARMPSDAPGVQFGLVGGDDIAATGTAGAGTVYVVVGTGGARELRAYDAASIAAGKATFVPQPLPDAGAIHLAPFAPNNVLLVSLEDESAIELVDMGTHQLVNQPPLPTQIAPLSLAVNEAGTFAYALNYWSNSITVLPADVLSSKFSFPYAALLEYRREAIMAFRDLLAGFLQYLKDCICDHLLVKCPTCDEDDKLYLACISIRNGAVYKVCNFSKRRYVKSFPTIGYWASILPVIPLLHQRLEEFCCMILPEFFSKYQAPTIDAAGGRPPSRIRYSIARTRVQEAQLANLPAKLRDARGKAGAVAKLVTGSLFSSLLKQPPHPTATFGGVVGQPTASVEQAFQQQGITTTVVSGSPAGLPDVATSIGGFLRTPHAGDVVTLHEQGGKVTFFSVGSPTAPVGADVVAQIKTLTDTVNAKDAQLADLNSQVQALQASHAQIAQLQDQVRALQNPPPGPPGPGKPDPGDPKNPGPGPGTPGGPAAGGGPGAGPAAPGGGEASSPPPTPQASSSGAALMASASERLTPAPSPIPVIGARETPGPVTNAGSPASGLAGPEAATPRGGLLSRLRRWS